MPAPASAAFFTPTRPRPPEKEPRPARRLQLSIAIIALLSVVSPGPATAQDAGYRPIDPIAPPAATAPVQLDQLTDPNSDFYVERQTFISGDIRTRQLASAARGVGLRAGYRDEALRINAAVEAYAQALNQAFDFEGQMLSQYVLPPVVSEVRDVEETSGGRFLYLTVGAFEIIKDGRLTTRPPHWRDYLTLPINDVRPPRGLITETAEERELWGRAVEEGWRNGQRDARAAFQTGIDILVRDIEGMRLYHELSREGVVSLPDINRTVDAWRVADDGKRAFEGEVVVRMAVEPRFIDRERRR